MGEQDLKDYKVKLAEAKARQLEAKVKQTQINAKAKSGSNFKKITKSVKYSPKLSKTLLSYGAGFSQVQSQGVQAGPGRPAGVMKHRSPFTGRPIPAPQFYKEMRAFRRIQAQQADKSQVQQQVQYARQGVPPSQIPQTVQERMKQQFIQQQMMQRQAQVQRPQQVQQPYSPQQGQVVSRATPVWRFRRGVVSTDWGLFGRRQVVNALPESFWN